MIKQFITQVVSKKELAPTAWLYYLKPVEPDKIDFIEGQYLITKIPQLDLAKSDLKNIPPPPGKYYRRHFSIASPSSVKDHIELLVQMVNGGVASTYYKNLQPGDEIIFDGPAGVFTLQSPDKEKIFLATGTGIAPIRSILLTNLNSKSQTLNPKQYQNTNDQNSKSLENLGFENSDLFRDSKLGFRIYLFWGLRNYDEVYFFDELKSLAEKNSNFKFKICLSRQEDVQNLDADFFARGRVNIQLAEFLTHKFEANKQFNNITIKQYINKFEYYLCGNRIIIESLRQFILGLGVEKQNIFFEKF